MSDPKALSPHEAMRAIVEESASDALEEHAKKSPAVIERDLREAGVEPEEAEQRARRAIEAALALVGETEATAGDTANASVSANATAPASPPTNVVPIASAQARKRGRWSRWAPVLAIGSAAAGLVGATEPWWSSGLRVAHGVPDDPHPVSPGDVRRVRYATTLAAALGACDKRDFAACERGLDDAKTIDPAGESDARVVAARRAIREWRARPTE
jgi:hypothetical protein